MKPIYVLGIDPGVAHTGVAIIDVAEMKTVYAETNPPIAVKMAMDMWPPVLVGIEEPFSGVNIKSYGGTKEAIGRIICELRLDRFEIIRTSPAAGNAVLKLARGDKKTDANKREAARALFGGINAFDKPLITNGHEASAAAAAVAAWIIYQQEVIDDDM